MPDDLLPAVPEPHHRPPAALRAGVGRGLLLKLDRALRTPLEHILELTAQLHQGAPGPEERAHLDDLLRAGRELEHVLDEVLAFAQLDVGGLALELAPASLGALCQDVVEALCELAALRRVRLSCDVRVETGLLDAPKVKLLLLDALAHALGCSPEGSEVALRVLPAPGGALRFEVEDGCPDDPPAPPHGHRAPLGPRLSLVRYLLEAEGASVGMSSRPGRGHLTFLVLPPWGPRHAT